MRWFRINLTLGCLIIAGGSALAAPMQAGRPTVRPGDDFYGYANADWLRSTTVPAGESGYGPTAMLMARNANRVREIIEAAALGPSQGASATDRALEQKIGDFYASVSDRHTIEAKDLRPFAAELDEIARITDRQSLSAQLGRTLRLDDGTNSQTESIFGIWVHQGFDEADRYVPHLVQGGLGLPTPAAYWDPASADARAGYKARVQHVLALAGDSNAEADSDDVLALETAIARTHASRADTDDPFKTNNHWRRADFETNAPGIDWKAYFGAAGLDQQDEFVVWQPSAVIGTSTLVARWPISGWKAYLTFHLLDHYSPVLPRAFAVSPQVADSEPRAIAATNAALGEAIGRLYVERYFPPHAKAAAAAMAKNLRRALRARLAKLPWMSADTRAKAITKLAALQIGVGFPDRWTDYSSLRIVRGDAHGNALRAERFAYMQALAKLGQPVDAGEWSTLAEDPDGRRATPASPKRYSCARALSQRHRPQPRRLV